MASLKLIDQLLGYVDAALAGRGSARVSAETYNALHKDIEALVAQKKCGAILVRLAWHDAGTYCAKTKTGGPRAAQRFKDGESTHGANAGLGIARGLLAPLVEKYCASPYNVSIADLWAFAGNTAICACGGPDIPFKFGRSDIASSKECVEEGRLPDGDKGLDHLRSVFGRMKFSDAEIVALSGAHTLGSCHADRSGFEGPWTADPHKFDNAYYKDIVGKKWVANKSSKGCPLLKNGNDAKDNTMMLTTDYCLFERDETKDLVLQFAKDQEAFFKAFGAAWTKLIGGNYTALYTAV